MNKLLYLLFFGIIALATCPVANSQSIPNKRPIDPTDALTVEVTEGAVLTEWGKPTAIVNRICLDPTFCVDIVQVELEPRTYYAPKDEADKYDGTVQLQN